MADKPDIISKMQGSQPSNNMISLLREIKDNIKNLSGGKENKDFRREENQSKYVDEIEPILKAQFKLQKENLGLQKDQKKKEGKGLLGLFGGLAFFAKAAGALTVGGLIGFILTGKKEFLFSVIKGFKKLFFDIPRQIFKMGGLIIKGLRGVFNIGKIIKKGGVVKALRKTALGRIGRVAGRKGIKAAGTYALKSMGKAIVKGGSKQVLKKIPVVGTLLGLFFAIQRFQKGDVVGGLLEIASGLSSLVNFIIPGGGLALGLLIDGILLFRDAKGAMKPQAPKETKPPKKVNKTEVNKIPIIGGFVAMFDAIKMVFGGDIIRGTKLFFVGMARTFPLPGMSFLLNKFVFPMIDATAHLFKISETVIGNVTTKATNMATSSFQDFIKLPVVGWFIEGIDGMINFVKDPKKGVEKIAAFMNNIIPGSGELLLKAGGAIFGAAKWIMDKGGAILKWTGNVIGNIGKAFSEENKSLIEIEKGVRGSDTGSVDATTGADKSVKPPAPPAKKLSLKHRIGQKMLEASKNLYQSSIDFKQGAIEKAMKDATGDVNQEGIQDIKGKQGDGWFAYKPWNPNLGVNPKMWDNFQSMSSEYFDKTGRMFQINSALRPSERDSVHSAGFAMDVNSPEVEDAESRGLLEKYGFHRPLLNWGPKETWHLEPYPGKEYGARNSNNLPFRRGLISGVSQIGGDNLPKDKIEPQVVDKSKAPIELSDATIKSLANAIGVSFKGAMPSPGPNQVSIDTGMRG